MQDCFCHKNTRNEYILTRNDTLCVLYNVKQKAASECHWKSENAEAIVFKHVILFY